MTPEEIAAVFRAEYGRAVAVLVRVLGDIDLAEDAVADAFATALQRWPGEGAPPSPAGWIITTARNRAIDQLRRESARAHKHAEAAIVHVPAEPVEEAPCPTTGCGSCSPAAIRRSLGPRRWRSPCACSAG
jgi:RNA polymerase sigma-70 factor (ECF subfamily)